MFFQDAQAQAFEKTVLDIVEGVLDAGFKSASHASKFAKYGGVKVTQQPEEGLQWFSKVKRPFVFLQLEGDDRSHWQKVLGGELHLGTKHDVTVSIEAVTNEKCNDAEADLVNAIGHILSGAYKALRDAGLEQNKSRKLKADEKPDRRNPFELTAVVRSVP